MRVPRVCALSSTRATIKILYFDLPTLSEAFARTYTENLGPSLTIGLYTELPDDIHDVDVIVAGGNSPLELLTVHLAFLLTNHHRRQSWLRGCITIGRSRPHAVHPSHRAGPQQL